MHELKPEQTTYRIERIAGEGRTATVYKAARVDSRGHSRLDVALKILKCGKSVPSLRREFDTLARVNSPQFVKMLGWENLPEGCALVLEWVDGATLFDVGSMNQLNRTLIDEIAAQIQAGLRVLHADGIHHGDLSPNNILIDREGRIRILDFATEPPVEDALFGTPAYLAPEVWHERKGSAAADLFALGLILHDLEGSFRFTPSDAPESRARSDALADDSQSLLDRDPTQRRMRKVVSKDDARQGLGFIVSSCLNARAKLQIQTQEISAPSAWRGARRPASAAVFLLLIISFIVSPAITRVGAQSKGPAMETPATLAVHSQKWLHLAINGRTAGYAPIFVSRMQPGKHVMSWQTRKDAGVARIDLKPGEHKVLTERDLMLLDAQGKR